MKKSTQRRPTMTDIAKLTGVSQSTVSLVLNNATGAKFSDATRNESAQGRPGSRLPDDVSATRFPSFPTCRRPTRSNLIVYLADEISTSPHPVVNIDGARDDSRLRATAACSAVYSTHGNAEIEQQVLDATLSNPQRARRDLRDRVHAASVTPPPALSKVPDRAAELLHERFAELSSVVPAEVAGGHTATDYLLHAGHTKDRLYQRRAVAGRRRATG